MAIQINQIILNQFRVDAFIASGGMGAVYKVWDLKRNVPLAMKVLHAELAEDPSMFKRFQREARALQKLAHPNIVPFYGLFQEGNLVFFLERYIDGPSLKEIIADQQGRPLSIQDTMVFLKALSSALGYAHANGVIHCDIKPGNVMVDRGGTIFLTDFGIARHAESTTTTFAGAGTAAYISPEQVHQGEVSAATDEYALGIIFYEMLTGQRPFRGSEPGTDKGGTTVNERVRYAQVNLPPPDPRSANPYIPEGIVKVIMKALAKRPEDRYPSTNDMLAAACSVVGMSPATIPDRIMLTRAVQPAAVKTYDIAATVNGEIFAPAVKPALKKPVIIGGLVLVLAVIAGVVFASGGLDRLGANNLPTGTLAELATEASAPSQDSPTLVVVVVTATSPPEATRAQAPSATVDAPSDTPTPVFTSPPLPSATIVVDVSINPKDGAEMVLIPEGEFMMGADQGSPYFWGAEAPAHLVYVNAFTIYRTEVTNGMYQQCVAAQACPLPQGFASRSHPAYYGNPDFDNYPVILVDWTSAISYCQWAGGTLPSEAQWEKAARGEDSRLFPWGNAPLAGNLANFCDRACPDDERETALDDKYADVAPVGNYPAGASPYGLLDMAGNVWEWVMDFFESGYYTLSPYDNPIGPADNGRHTIRGGSWTNPSSGVRTVARTSLKTNNALDTLGFRCVVP